jgi:hypothetical protein
MTVLAVELENEMGRFGSAAVDRTSVWFEAPSPSTPMSAMDREREFADRNSGHSGAGRPGALAVQLRSVSCPPQTGR